ncbi:UNVERIFIED_CONTAM: hypothetical protein LK11_46505 [Mumia flava]
MFLASITVFAAAAWTRPSDPAPHARYLLAASVNEIPHLFGAALLLATALAWAQGDLGGPAGLILTGVACATLAALAGLLVRSLSAPVEVRSALAASGIQPALRSRVRALLAPLPLRPLSVRRVRGIAYGPDRRQRLDVYARRGGAYGPVLVYFHGGGYYSGGRHREARALLHHLAAQGWVCISAGYRLRPAVSFSEHLADARTALAWAHRNAGSHGGDTSRLVLAGSSAGAHLGSVLALTQDLRTPHSRVDAVVGLYGYYGGYYGHGPAEAASSSPLLLPPDEAPPFFLAHGDRDSWVPVEQARALRDHLADGAVPVTYVELSGAQHGFDLFSSVRFTSVVDGVESFLDAALRRQNASTARSSE